MGNLGRILRQGIVMELTRTIRVQTDIELVFPTEFKTRLGHGIVANLGSRMAFRQISSMRSQFVNDDAFLDVVLVRQAKMFLRRDVARIAVPNQPIMPAPMGGSVCRNPERCR